MAKRVTQATTYSHLDQEIVAMMDNATHCLCCGRPLNYLPKKEQRRARGYCCWDCYLRKPPKMAYAERVWGKPIEKVVLEMLNAGRSTEAVAEVLGITKRPFFDWLRKLRIRRVVKWEVAR